MVYRIKYKIKDKYMSAKYLQLQEKIEAYNKIVKNEFLVVKNIFILEKKERLCILCFNKHRIKQENIWRYQFNGYTSYEMFLSKGRLKSCNNDKKAKQIKSVTYVGKWIYYLCNVLQFNL
jgi:hypothetical protein